MRLTRVVTFSKNVSGTNCGTEHSKLLLHVVAADYVKTCQIRQPGFVNCSTLAVQRLFNAIPAGIDEIGLAPLDPLKVPIIKVP